jgi:aryl-alcohol dehydrogenase-like predicted oxidoreductase
VDFEKGLQAVEELRTLVPQGFTMAQFALKWILMFPEVSTVIPGAKNPRQAEENAKTSDLPPLKEEVMERIREIYEEYILPDVHHRW